MFATGFFSGNGNIFGEPIAALGADNTDYIARISDTGETLWVVAIDGGGNNRGGEVDLDQFGPVYSAAGRNQIATRLSTGTMIETTDVPASTRDTSTLLFFSAHGTLRFAFAAQATDGNTLAGGGAVAVSPSGQYTAQGVRLSGSAMLGNQSVSTRNDRFPVFYTATLTAP